MAAPPPETLDALRSLAAAQAARAHVPYSGREEAAVLLLSDRAWVPGARVESASFSLVIPPLVNAFTTAAAAGRTDVRVVALSRTSSSAERAYVAESPFGPFAQAAPDVWVREDEAAWPDPASRAGQAVGARLDPFLETEIPRTSEEGIALARRVAERAVVPQSGFPVGCVLETSGGRLIPGVNVEHADWSRTLCAERGALGTAVSYGLAGFGRLFLSCLRDPKGTPCGACRQLLVELAPEAALWMDRGPASPEAASPARLMPGSFTGDALPRALVSRA